MTKLRIYRFPDRIAEIIYFIIDKRSNLVYGVVEETKTDIKLYDVCTYSYLHNLKRLIVDKLLINPVGEGYETGEPRTIKKSLLAKDIIANELYVTKNINEVYSILTG